MLYEPHPLERLADRSTGGVQPYLKYIFGDVFGFLAAWTWVVAVMPATLAILSIVFIESIYSAAGVTGEGDRLGHKLLSIAVLACIGVANSISTKASTRLNNFFVATKFVTIAAIVLAGTVVAFLHISDLSRDVGGGDWNKKSWFGYRDSVNPDGSVTHWEGLSQWDTFGHLSAALYAALWAYSGWDKVCWFRLWRESCSGANREPGNLYLGRTFVSGPPTAPGHQHFDSQHYPVLSHGKCCLLHPAALGYCVDDG
jgi:amino acid transporter